jgi:hypothetical protein|tara:strand:+ start:21 stop:164 length:144 start_codon:yes stop_codon:yes gene_type:complete
MTFQELSDYNDHYMLQEADWSGWGKRAAGVGAAAAAREEIDFFMITF